MRRARILVTVFLVLLAPALARASDESGAHESSLLWHAINLALVVGVLGYFARTPIRTYMAERRQNIEAGIEAARRELSEAESRLVACNDRVASLDREIEEIRRTVHAQAENERERLLADARVAAERIHRDAHAAVEQESRRAREDLRNEAVEMAVRLAGDLLKRQVTDADRARLVDEFVERVEASPPAVTTRS
ncbi:MAG: ATPase [Deltaproteobacteria bacterium]|nr:ATPase [Deltaproteobacteria bacterium]